MLTPLEEFSCGRYDSHSDGLLHTLSKATEAIVTRLAYLFSLFLTVLLSPCFICSVEIICSESVSFIIDSLNGHIGY